MALPFPSEAENPVKMQPSPPKTSQRRRPVTIKSIMVMTAVFASTAASLAHLWRAANGDTEEVGRFVVATAMSPLLLMIAAYWTIRIAKSLRD